MLKIVVIGAGSRSFGPSTVRDVLLSKPIAAQGAQLVLVDIAAEPLAAVENYARQVGNALKTGIQISAATDLEVALDGADFVVTAIELQRFKYWSMDFHVPRKHGFRQIFGENGGPGGLFHALRNFTPMLNIARKMERLCPGALLLNFTNPEHKVCEAISRLTSIRSMGLCHGFFMGLHQIAMLLGRNPADIDVAACGMNHCTFFQYIRDRNTGEDLYPLLGEREREGDWLSQWHEIALGRVMFRRFGLWPSPGANHYGEYINWAEEFVPGQLQYFYDPHDGHPWETGAIPEFVYTINNVKDDRPWVKPIPVLEPLENAELRASGEVAIPIIEAVGCGVAQRIDAVNVPNNGAIPNLPDDMVVEIPALASRGALENCQMAPLPEPLAAILRLHGSIHKVLVEAYAEQSRDKLIQAMLLEPTVDSYRRAVECVDEMLRLQKKLLPEFK